MMKKVIFCFKFILYSIPDRGFNTILKLLSNDINLLATVLDEILILCQPQSNQCNEVNDIDIYCYVLKTRLYDLKI